MVKPYRLKRTISFRLPNFTVRDFLSDFGVIKQLLGGTDIDNFLAGSPDFKGTVAEIKIVYDNEPCPFHGYPHYQIVPNGKEPMSCAEAAK